MHSLQNPRFSGKTTQSQAERWRTEKNRSSNNNRWAETPNYADGASVEYRRWGEKEENLKKALFQEGIEEQTEDFYN